MNRISLRDVWLKYRIDFKENGKIASEDFWALKAINMDIEEGEAVFIIGENGAGKTSLLKIIAGILNSDEGVVKVNGTVSALLEIGAGFNKDLTGRENIYLTSSFFGLTREQIDVRYPDIIKFASIGRFINAPVKNYSQGMYMRLAFAIAIHVDPEILLIDDIFVVGDLYAQRKCADKMFELKEMGKTIIFVTHSIETAKRFCQRGVLLKDGRIIKEGRLKEVASCYLKTIGDKKGIAILQGSRLEPVFNNGKLILNWRDNSITKERAGHISVLSKGSWHSSLQADWEVRESGRDRMVLEGKCWDLPVWQLWDIQLDDVKNEIAVKIEFDVRQDCDFEECKISFMFKDGYKHWFDPSGKEPFKIDDLSKESSWRCVNSRTPGPNFIGLGISNNPDEFLPSIVMEDDLYIPGKILNIQNTDRIFRARALESRITSGGIKGMRLKAGRHLLFHNRIRVIDTPEGEDDYRQNAAKAMLPKTISDNASTRLTVENNRIGIYWRDKIITASKGLKTIFYYDGRIHQSSDTLWMIHKVSDNRVDILMQWPDSPIKQAWNIELLGNGLLSWKAYIETSERVIVRNNEFRFMFSPQYQRWFTSEEEGKIGEELSVEDYKDIVMRNDPSGIVGLEAVSQDNLELPCVLLHDTTKSRFNSLEKHTDINTFSQETPRKAESVTYLYMLDADTEESSDFPKGVYLICDARILIGDNSHKDSYLTGIRKTGEKCFSLSAGTAISDGEAVLESRECKFSFAKGTGRIFLDGTEITKNFGVYTSLYSRQFYERGVWYASVSALWEVISCGKKRLVVKGIWPYLPVAQIWEIKTSRHGFVWRVDMKIYAPVRIERQHANLMLSDSYKGWNVRGRQSGTFVEDFTVAQWDNLYRERAADRLRISAEGNHPAEILPGVNISCLKEGRSFEAIVENSNTIYKSRN